MRLLSLLLLTVPFAVQAQDARLVAIRELLLPMRTSVGGLKARGATPNLTIVKHLLLDWIESRLSGLQWDGFRWNPNPVVFQEQLNDDLTRAGLICGGGSKIACPEWSELGFVGRVVLDMQGVDLVVRTSVGIQNCGEDESAYAYEQSGNQWHRFWQSEQNNYEEGKYFPQRLEQVAVSPADYRRGADRTERLILTLGVNPWCTSVWHPVYYRVWQTKSTYREPLLLLDGNELADIGNSIDGSAGPSDVHMEYFVEGVEGGFRSPELRHYELKQGKLERVEPIALTPRDFVAFWLRHPWSESSSYTETDSRSTLAEWLQKHTDGFNEFGFPTLHCKQQPDLWQLSTEAGKDRDEQVYFLIRWHPPYHFTMISATSLPSPDCTEEDPEVDKPRSLFRVQ